MAIWNVPAKLPYAHFVAGDERLGAAARPALDRVLESLANGPPPAVELGTWIAQAGRTGAVSLAALRAQLPVETLAELGLEAGQRQRLSDATHGMLIAADDGNALDSRAPWGLLVIAAAMASAADGVVYDSGTFRLLPQWILENPLDGFLLGSIKNHVAIVSSTASDGATTTTTLGLNKFGLFELQLDGVHAPAEEAGLLVAGLAQALVDARPPVPGAWDVPATLAVTRFHVAHACALEPQTSGGSVSLGLEPPAGDEIYWSVRVPNESGVEPDFADILRTLDIGAAGAQADAVETALAQATRIARNRLSEAQAAFARRALTEDVVLVKTSVAPGDSRRGYVWSRVEQWERTHMLAVVSSGVTAASAPGIGDRVTLDVDDIVDWRIERRSGETLGDFAAQALRGTV